MTSEKTNEMASIALTKIEEIIASGLIESELSLKNGSFRKTVKKGSHPLTSYVHRMIQFNSGINTCIPTTTQFDLQNFVDEIFGQKGISLLDTIKGKKEKFTVYILSDGVEKLYDALDNYAEELTAKFGMNPNRVLYHWKNCL